jgi:ABC-type phosphate transport system substrate-binding protein
MSAFKQKMGSMRVRAGLLVGASLAVLAIGGASASSAMAVTAEHPTPLCTQEGTNIQGIGSSLQRVAQEYWTGRTVPSGTPLEGLPHAANALANSYREKCAGKKTPPTVSYTSTGSGMGLAALGYTGLALESQIAFAGTDDGPNATQIANAKTASGAEPVILPVSQTAIAVMVHLPAGCTLSGITWADLNKVWGGASITKWSQFSTIGNKATCEATEKSEKEAAETKAKGEGKGKAEQEAAGVAAMSITRVVRAEGSGTTLQFKNYLQALHTTAGIGAEKLPCVTEGTEEWEGLEAIGTGEKPNTVWPKCTAGSTSLVTAAGGGAVAEKVDLSENAIGYAALPDAEAHLTHGASLAKLENGTPGGIAHFESPANTATNNARCENARYTVPTNGIRAIGHTGLAVDWSTVFGAAPKIMGTEYPLCTLTYVTAWNEYKEAKYGVTHEAIERLVGDYIMNYVIQSAAGLGQSAISGQWYAPLPIGSGSGTASDVQDSAEFIATNLKE